MSPSDVWSEADLDHILGKYGLMAVSRAGSDVDSFLAVSLHLTYDDHSIYITSASLYVMTDRSSSRNGPPTSFG